MTVVIDNEHAREAGDIATRILKGGQLDLTPPGITVPVRELLPEVYSGSQCRN
jgi:hypothetical protein